MQPDLLRFVLWKELRDDQPTPARLERTLPKSRDGTESTEADGNCCRAKPHTAKSKPETTSCTIEHSAKAEECLSVFFSRLLSPGASLIDSYGSEGFVALHIGPRPR
ncbi:MAG TPA: hypothetical protein VFL34_15805, partial [Candidatus Sulfotelmatobacter sp.]|nr:hypothetical protein [Candidatus Sulfotelmatobacter sp.]